MWYTISAKYHLLDPDGSPIDPYDETLSGASVGRKREWSQPVFNQLRQAELLTSDSTLVFHAGRDNYDKRLPLLGGTPVQTETPTDGLRYGETLSWYNDRI